MMSLPEDANGAPPVASPTERDRVPLPGDAHPSDAWMPYVLIGFLVLGGLAGFTLLIVAISLDWH